MVNARAGTCDVLHDQGRPNADPLTDWNKFAQKLNAKLSIGSECLILTF